MRKKEWANRTAALALSATVTVAGIPFAGPIRTARAAEGTDESIVYAVDCGDLDTSTAPDDGPLGTHNSVTDQVYGKDSVTGYMWGVDDTVSAPLKNGTSPAGGVSTDWTWPYEFTASDQKSKLLTNRYTKEQFESNIDPRHLDYKFELENGKYLVEVGFTDPWACSQSPSVYANYGKSSQTVIAENFAVASNNGVAAATVEVSDGELTVNARGTGDANKAINITYITIKKGDDETAVKSDLSALSVRDQVTSDIELPKSGQAGSTITWVSSDEKVITADGKVTRPASGEADASVTLTATVEKGEVKLTKEFSVTVPAAGNSAGLEYFDRTAVEVTDAYYDNALELDAKNLLALDADRLLAGFRETAAYAAGMSEADRKSYMKDKTRYGGGWENSLIGGHTLGHYISAVAQGVINPGLDGDMQAKLKERLDYIVDALADCQAKTVGSTVCKEGYIFGATLTAPQTNLEMQFDNVEKGAANISTQAWVPWYTMHKILAGLVDAYQITGSKTALATAEKLGDWVADRANGWSDATQRTVLGIEYGGMNDAMYELYKCTNKQEYKTAAHMFDEVTLFENVLSGNANVLNAKHANTTIPKFLGALCRYEADNAETKYLEYAQSFWDMVVSRHTYITGGNSEDEHFGADNILHAERTNCNNETCNTYNMLKLSRRLFVITGEKKYADYYENTLINAIMSSQDHKTGLTMYFQPMATGYHKVFGTLDTNFWCCTGSGMENFTKLQDSIYFKDKGLVVVNQYLASKASGDGYTIEQTGDLSVSDTMTFKVSGSSLDFAMQLRVPDWVPEGKVVVRFGEETYAYTVTDAGYIVIPKDKLTDGTVFTVQLPMEVVAFNLPDSENTYAFKYGPFVLSAKLGKDSQSTGSHGVSVTVPTSKAVSSDSVGIMAEASVSDFMAKINDYMVKEEGSMNFTLNGTDFKYPFTTHYNQDEENYGIYWTYSINEDGRGSEAVLAEKKEKRMNRILIDQIAQTGRGQYEERFILADGETKDGLVDNNSVAEDAPDLTRRASAGGSFGYKMEVAEGEDNYVLVTYRKSEDGKPMKISVGDTVLFDGKLDSKTADAINLNLSDADSRDYYQVMYKISSDVVEKNVASLEVLEDGKKVTKRVILITFAGTGTEESARVCRSMSMLRAVGTTNSLTGVSYDGKKLSAVNDTYTISIPYNVTPEVTFEIADSNGYVEVDGSAIDETQPRKLKKASSSGAVTSYTVKVYAEDFKTAKTYTINVEKDYSGVSLKDNLVKSFGFENSTNDAVAVTKASTPVENNSAAYQYQEGAVGNAIALNGTYGLKLLDNANALGESYTISFWMNSKNVGANFDPTIAGGVFAPEYWLNMTLDGKIWSKNGDYIATEASGAYQANKWQQVTLVVDGETAGTANGTVVGRIYVDGEVVSRGNVAKGIMTQSGAKLYFGVNAWDAYFSGALDDVMIFNKALTDEEVGGIASKAITSASLGGGNGQNTNNTVAAKSVTVRAAGYTLSGSTMTLVQGKKAKLTTRVLPAKASQKVSYSSNKTGVATVSSAGVITAKKAGTAKIQVRTANGKKKVITVKVVKKAKINTALTVKKKTMSITKGKTAAIAIKKLTKNTTSTISYKSSANKVASVNKFGVVTAKSKGKAVILVKCGKKSVKVKVTVK